MIAKAVLTAAYKQHPKPINSNPDYPCNNRVYHLGPAAYAPVLATLLPIGGIIGGVGGGWLADKLAKTGHRVWITAGASALAAPFLLKSVTAEVCIGYTAMGGCSSGSCNWGAPAYTMHPCTSRLNTQ